MKDSSFVVDPELDGRRLDAVLRHHHPQVPWAQLRRLIETGKVALDTAAVLDPATITRAHQRVEIFLNAPRPASRSRLPSEAIVFVDAHLVVVRKPAGINSVPYEPGERGTLQELVRAWLNRSARARGDRTTGDLGVVHRIDKETSGLLVFTRTLLAKRHVANQMRFHSTERRYLALVHGRVTRRTIESNLVANRGDGLRGSTRSEGVGQHAITHVEPLEHLGAATLIECRLETGRTHQIRIHLSEAGHPLVGERVYNRGFDGPQLQAPRLMLHAAVLGLTHPVTQKLLRWEDPMPEDMRAVYERLRGERT